MPVIRPRLMGPSGGQKGPPRPRVPLRRRRQRPEDYALALYGRRGLLLRHLRRRQAWRRRRRARARYPKASGNKLTHGSAGDIRHFFLSQCRLVSAASAVGRDRGQFGPLSAGDFPSGRVQQKGLIPVGPVLHHLLLLLLVTLLLAVGGGENNPVLTESLNSSNVFYRPHPYIRRRRRRACS
jgi:hypothetical protein